jgi:hypothetical protein
MEERRRSGLVVGLILILLGAYFFAVQLFPGLREWLGGFFDWPIFVIGAGVLLLLIGLASGESGMSVPAMIVGGIGGILLWQSATERWDTWAYLWTLIPGFVGLGVALDGILSRQMEKLREGLGTVLVSLVLFAVFGSWLGPFDQLGLFWPVILIVLGVYLLVRPMVRWD